MIIFPRLGAAIAVVLLIGSLALAGIGGVAFLGPLLAHGDHVQHSEGSILTIGPGKDFVLKTTAGASLRFHCGGMCRTSLGHMQRHLREHAHTDVYYIPDMNNSLLAIDVD